ncbi:MAG: DUF2326 domain-containing protein, partial [Ignavibacteria bacterium]|nr:DUF2326 domain-containing protein [Ignavibacteria bacterium]
MKLSRLYTNNIEKFTPIDFRPGLNVIMAEIRLPENKNKDTHNLGKSLLGRLIDFCLLATRDPNFFLFKYPHLFNEFVFFLEIEITSSTYLTIRRSVKEPTKISFKKHDLKLQDYSGLPNDKWDHQDIPFNRAVELLDSLLNLQALTPWTFRKGLGYQLRSQGDYRDVFQLGKYVGKHADWKPYLSHIIGFNSSLISDLYGKEEEISKLKNKEFIIQQDLRGSVEDLSKIEGLLLIKQKELEKKQVLLDAFDFRSVDKQKSKVIIDDIDVRIAALNSD